MATMSAALPGASEPTLSAIPAASAALTISGLPFRGPIGAARVGMIDGKLVINPMLDEMDSSSLDLVVAGTGDAVMMVESEAKELPEDTMLEAVMFGHKGFQPVIDAIIQLAEKAAKEPWDFTPPDTDKYKSQVAEIAEADLRKAFATPSKQDRVDMIAAAWTSSR